MFNSAVTRFVRGNHQAMLLRIDPNDHWLGLVRFDDLGETRWMNFAEMCISGEWRPLLRTST
jgi:hypothetical protein